MKPTKTRLPKPPAHLSRSSKEWFRQVTERFVLDEHHVKLLVGCCECLDRASEARQAVAKDGAYVRNRFNELKKHPGIGVEQGALSTFSRLLRELGLDLSAEPARPPGIMSAATRRKYY
jgi:P27 family predicted phage terminase small subunit